MAKCLFTACRGQEVLVVRESSLSLLCPPFFSFHWEGGGNCQVITFRDLPFLGRWRPKPSDPA